MLAKNRKSGHLSGGRGAPAAMTVAGVMSGTSADGIDVALVQVHGGGEESPQFEFVGHAAFAYPARVRRAVLGAMNAESASVPDLARMNSLLAELYADAVRATARQFGARIDLVGCHGQTLYHQSEAAAFLGRKLAVTWQTGDGSVLAQRLGVSVVSDFRPADMAADGRGAPLVPFLDAILYRDTKAGRIALNIGGIANITAIPAGSGTDKLIAFDTGPGNMVVDALCERFFQRKFDRGGNIAAKGTIDDALLKRLLRHGYFRRPHPKTAGREQFGREFVDHLLGKSAQLAPHDLVATATALTVQSIVEAIREVGRSQRKSFAEVVASGGGTRNATIMRWLGEALLSIGVRVRRSDEFGIPSEAKEAVAFALLAYETWHRRPSNVPSATGAKRPVILGKVSYV